MKNTITEDEAIDRAEDYVRQAMSALPPVAHLEDLSPTSSLACDDPTDKGPRGRVTVGNIFWVRGISNELRHFDAMVGWWKAHDFEIVRDLRPEHHSVSVENKKDGFRMSFEDNPKGELSIGADSPCVWPNGTPAPE